MSLYLLDVVSTRSLRRNYPHHIVPVHWLWLINQLALSNDQPHNSLLNRSGQPHDIHKNIWTRWYHVTVFSVIVIYGLCTAGIMPIRCNLKDEQMTCFESKHVFVFRAENLWAALFLFSAFKTGFQMVCVQGISFIKSSGSQSNAWL